MGVDDPVDNESLVLTEAEAYMIGGYLATKWKVRKNRNKIVEDTEEAIKGSTRGMPLATIDTITRIEDLSEYWLQKLEDNMDELNFKFVGGYDEPIKTSYPAVVIGGGTATKEINGTNTYLVQFMLDFYICHAEATETHRKRSLKNLQQVTQLVNFLEADLTLGNRVIFAYVLSERAGILQPRTSPTKFLVSTVITYQATLKTRFK